MILSLLPLDQGARWLIESTLFAFFFTLFLWMTKGKDFLLLALLGSALFALWGLSSLLANNAQLALSVTTPDQARIGNPWRKSNYLV